MDMPGEPPAKFGLPGARRVECAAVKRGDSAQGHAPRRTPADERSARTLSLPLLHADHPCTEYTLLNPMGKVSIYHLLCNKPLQKYMKCYTNST